ncbi:MAG: glycosyltransferase family 4 protein [Bacteroidaceae bacterium]
MKKILHLGIALAPYRMDFYNALAKEYKADFYFLQNRMNSSIFNIEELKEQCCFDVKLIKTVKFRRNYFYSIGVFKLIWKERPQCIFVPEYSLLTVKACLIKHFLFWRKMKVVSVCDDSIDMICGNDFTFIHRLARRILAPVLNDLILLDKYAVEWYQNKYRKGIYFPLIRDDVKAGAMYKKLIPLSNKLNCSYGIQGEKIILFVGRLVALKNIESLIKAYSKIKNKARLVIIGSGEEELKLKKTDRMLKTNILFTGRLEGDELMAWYNIADVFVLPSYQEAFGAVTNEALLAGCRVVVSKRAGSSSIVTDINGTIVDPLNENALTKAMLKELALTRKKGNTIEQKSSLMQMTFNEAMQNVLKKI